ncbi:metallophosphatase family protein [candidate division KSB1 bacterium]|nr:metallophosphatase family protein [candidate division KSB1 bacterium]
MQIGVISDTHGYLNPIVTQIFKDVDLILHAGDIGREKIIFDLEKIAPVKAVFGNTDYLPIRGNYPAQQLIELANFYILLIHRFDILKATDRESIRKIKFLNLIICGHTHLSSYQTFDKLWILNPGSAGSGRRLEPPTVARLSLIPNTPAAVKIIRL